MSRFGLLQTAFDGLLIIERRPIVDRRGSLERLYCSEDMRALGLELPLAQINRTLTLRRASVRGLHFQHPPHAEHKLISCLRGAVFDVAVDLRAGSSTFLRWHAEVLDADNQRSLLIPPGFAHGFQSLVDGVEMLYFHTASYAPQSEGGISVAEPRIGIEWPLPMEGLSDRDRQHPPLPADYAGLRL